MRYYYVLAEEMRLLSPRVLYSKGMQSNFRDNMGGKRDVSGQRESHHYL